MSVGMMFLLMRGRIYYELVGKIDGSDDLLHILYSYDLAKHSEA